MEDNYILTVKINERQMDLWLLVTGLGKQRIILGFSWLNKNNPNITGKLAKFPGVMRGPNNGSSTSGTKNHQHLGKETSTRSIRTQENPQTFNH